jgi:hypothetical protein
VKKPVLAAFCLFLFAIPAVADSADHQGPAAVKGDHIRRGGIGGGFGGQGSDSNRDADGSTHQGAGDPGAASAGGGGIGSGGGGTGGDTGATVAPLAEVIGDIFGNAGDSRSGLGIHHGAPGPVAGAGLPFLGVAYGVYWLIRRRRKAG